MEKYVNVIEMGRLAWETAQKDEWGKVHSVFGKVINLCFQGRGMLSLAALDIPMSPIHMKTDWTNFYDLTIETGDLVERKEGVMRVGEVFFDLRHSKPYISKLVDICRTDSSDMKKAKALKVIQSEAMQQGKSLEGFVPLLPYIISICEKRQIAIRLPLFAQQGYKSIKRMVVYYEEGKEDAFLEEASKLIGLGPGLTPSGDDFLSGFMIGYIQYHKWQGQIDFPFKNVAKEISQRARALTNDISVCQLRLAAQGCGNELLEALCVHILSGRDDGANHLVEKIMKFGSTSGLDQLAGLLFGIKISLSGEKFMRSQ